MLCPINLYQCIRCNNPGAPYTMHSHSNKECVSISSFATTIGKTDTKLCGVA